MCITFLQTTIYFLTKGCSYKIFAFSHYLAFILLFLAYKNAWKLGRG